MDSSETGDVQVAGAVFASALYGDGSLMTFATTYLSATAAPDDPDANMAVIWMDSTSGDLKVKLNLGGSVKTGTLADFSAL